LTFPRMVKLESPARRFSALLMLFSE